MSPGIACQDPEIARWIPFVPRPYTIEDAQTRRTFKVNRDPECPACGPDAGEIVIAEYDEHCMPHPKEAPPPSSS